MTAVRHRDHASECSGSMSTGHLSAMASPAIVGGKTIFGFTCANRRKHKVNNQRGSIHCFPPRGLWHGIGDKGQTLNAPAITKVPNIAGWMRLAVGGLCGPA